MKERMYIVLFVVVVAFLALSTACAQVPVAPVVMIPEKESQTPRPASAETPVPPTLTSTSIVESTETPASIITPTSTLTDRQQNDADMRSDFEIERDAIEQYLKYTYDLFMGKFESYGIKVDLSNAVDENGVRRKPEFYYTLNYKYTPMGDTDESRKRDFDRKVGSIEEEVTFGNRYNPTSLWVEANWLRSHFMHDILVPNYPFEKIENYEIPIFETFGDIIYFPVDTSRIGKFIEEPHAIKEGGTGFRFITSGGIDFELLCEYSGDINFEVTPMECRVTTKKGGTIIKEELFTTSSDALFEVGFCSGGNPGACSIGGKGGEYIGNLTAFSPAAGKFMMLNALGREGAYLVASVIKISMTLNGDWDWVFLTGYSQEDWCNKYPLPSWSTNRYDLLNYFDHTPEIGTDGTKIFPIIPVIKPIWVTIDHTERCPVITPFEK